MSGSQMKDFSPTGRISKVLQNHYAVKHFTQSQRSFAFFAGYSHIFLDSHITLRKCKHLILGTNTALSFFFFTSVLSYFLLCSTRLRAGIVQHTFAPLVPRTVPHVEQVHCKETLISCGEHDPRRITVSPLSHTTHIWTKKDTMTP